MWLHAYTRRVYFPSYIHSGYTVVVTGPVYETGNCPHNICYILYYSWETTKLGSSICMHYRLRVVACLYSIKHI